MLKMMGCGERQKLPFVMTLLPVGCRPDMDWWIDKLVGRNVVTVTLEWYLLKSSHLSYFPISSTQNLFFSRTKNPIWTGPCFRSSWQVYLLMPQKTKKPYQIVPQFPNVVNIPREDPEFPTLLSLHFLIHLRENRTTGNLEEMFPVPPHLSLHVYTDVWNTVLSVDRARIVYIIGCKVLLSPVPEVW